MDYVIGVDLGAKKIAVCCIQGPSEKPLLQWIDGKWALELCQDYHAAAWLIYYWTTIINIDARIFAEETFSAGTRNPKKQFLRMTGINQEKTAGDLRVELARLGCEELERIKPVNDRQAHLAWLAMCRPTLKGKTLGGQLKDSLGVGLAGLIHLEELRREAKRASECEEARR